MGYMNKFYISTIIRTRNTIVRGHNSNVIPILYNQNMTKPAVKVICNTLLANNICKNNILRCMLHGNKIQWNLHLILIFMLKMSNFHVYCYNNI